MTSVAGNLRLAGRRILKTPGFSLAVVLTLALGVGINTLIFSIINAVLLAPLPYEQADRLVMAWETQSARSGEKSEVAPGNFVDWRRQTGIFEEMAAYFPVKMNVAGRGDPEQVQGVRVTPGFFDVLRVAPALGSLPGADESADPVVVLSHGYWRERFGGERDVLGRTLRIDDRLCRIAAVLPAAFDLPQGAVIWVPQPITPEASVRRENKFLHVVARLAPGVGLEPAKLALGEVARRLGREYPETNQGWLADVVPLREQLVGPIRPVLLIAMTIVGFVLLLACINIVNLLLAREQGRRREIALRTALGARRQDLARQLLAETLLLAALGGALGLLLAWVGLPLLTAMSPVEIPRLAQVRQVGIDGRVLLFTGVVALSTGVLFGVLPSLSRSRVDLQSTLKEGGGKASTGAGGVWTREILVIAEVGLAFAVLVSAGLMVRTCVALLQTDPGFKADRLLTMKVLLPQSRYPEAPEKISFFGRALERLQALPGVAGAAGTTSLPLSGYDTFFQLRIEGRPSPGPDERPSAGFDSVTPDYFEVMGIPLRSGRAFTAADRADAVPVVIVSQTLARRYWPGENPIGRRLEILDAGDVGVREVVGVVGDILRIDLQSAAEPALYVPFVQYPVRQMALILKTQGSPALAADSARRAILALDPDLAVAEVQTFDRLLLASFARQRWTALLLSVFSLLGLLLAAVGIYGVMSYHSGQRAREIGIRMALGATRGQVLRLVLVKAVRLTILGVAGGCVVGLLLGRSLASLLFAVRPGDPVTFAVTALFLGAVALLASFLPARRAAAAAPAMVLRIE
jgi:putative ABC transport system permease protein